MKILVVALLCSLSFGGPSLKGVPESVSIDAAGLTYFLAGLFVGMEIDLDVQDFENCELETETIISGLEKGIQDLEERTFESVFAGLAEIAEALESVPADIEDCKEVPDSTFDDLEKALKIFQNPVSLTYVVGKTLVLDGRSIFVEIDAGRTAWANGDYYNSGLNFGKAFFKFAKYEQD